MTKATMIPTFLYNLFVQRHPMSLVLLTLWTDGLAVDGLVTKREAILRDIENVVRAGGRIYLKYRPDNQSSSLVEATLIFEVDELEKAKGIHTWKCQVSWSASIYDAADALRGAELHLDLARLAVLLESTPEVI